MKITIIISCHKDSPYLTEAIESALKQNFDDYDVILSSNGWEDCKKYAKTYGLDYILTEKKNTSSALNNAVRHISSEWFKELHYDDILLPNCLTDLYGVHEGASQVYANAINFWDTGLEQLYKSPPAVEWRDIWPPFKGIIHGGTLLTNTKDFIELGGYDENLTHSEEYDYYLKLLSNNKRMNYCDSIVMRYRRHSEQKTAGYTKQLRNDTKEYILKKYDYRDGSTSGL